MEQKYVKPTLSRILKPDGKGVMIALDHARMNGLVNGLHDQKRVIEAVDVYKRQGSHRAGTG